MWWGRTSSELATLDVALDLKRVCEGRTDEVACSGRLTQHALLILEERVGAAEDIVIGTFVSVAASICTCASSIAQLQQLRIE